ncbi:hypothetical protein D3C86_1375000 [compost metagenome]
MSGQERINGNKPHFEFSGIKDGDHRLVASNNHVVVCIDAPHSINQFNMIPPRFQSAWYDVSVHSDPKWVMQEGLPCFNFDILITGDEKWKGIVPADRLFLLKRLSKTRQAIAINQFLREAKTANALIVPTYGSNFSDKYHPSYLGTELTGKIVIKPADGARGLCHFVVDFDQVSVGPFLRDLYGATTIADMAEKYAPHAHLSHGQAWDDEESQKVKEEGNFTFQRYVDDIQHEIRILTNHVSDIGFACIRNRIGDVYKQATSATVMLENICSIGDKQLVTLMGGQGELDVFKKLLEEVIGPMQSVDLFITKDGRWGICEYCNQYGIAGVPREYSVSSISDFVMHCIDESRAHGLV